MWTRSLRLARTLPRAIVLTAVAAGTIVMLATLAGRLLGPAALALSLPAAAAAGALRRRSDARHAGLVHLAQVDPLTGLGTPALLRQRLRYELGRHTRHQRRLAVLTVTMSGLDDVGDRYGRAAVDEVVRELARRLARAVRAEDTVVRLSPRGFAILAPETGWRDVDALGERLQFAVRQATGGDALLAATLGQAVFPEEGATPELLLARAAAPRRPALEPEAAAPVLRSVA